MATSGSGGGIPSRDEEERKRQLQLQKQQAAQKAQKAPVPGAETPGAPPSPAAVAPVAPPANPLLRPPAPGEGATPSIVADAQAANAAALQNMPGNKPPPVAEKARVIQTPYGTVSTTNPQGQAKLERLEKIGLEPTPNVLTKGRPLDAAQSAEKYRNLVATGAPLAQRAAAKQEYADALNQRAAGDVGGGIRGESTGSAYSQVRPRSISASQAFGMPQRVVSPAERERIMHYNDMFPSLTQGQNPLKIGTASLAHAEGERGGMKVMSRDEETDIRNSLNEKAKEIRDLRTAERVLKRQGKFDESMDKRKQRRLMEAESGLKNPMNPKAGLDVDNAFQTEVARRELARDSGSRAGLAQKEITREATERAQQESKAATERVRAKSPEWAVERKREEARRLEALETERQLREQGGVPQQRITEGQEDLAAAIERQRLANEAWLAEQRRRTLAYR